MRFGADDHVTYGVAVGDVDGDGYPDVGTANSDGPNIIYVNMPGYGTDGPYKDWVAFGPSVEPLSGLTHVMGYSREEPRNTAMALIDAIAAMSTASPN